MAVIACASRNRGTKCFGTGYLKSDQSISERFLGIKLLAEMHDTITSEIVASLYASFSSSPSSSCVLLPLDSASPLDNAAAGDALILGLSGGVGEAEIEPSPAGAECFLFSAMPKARYSRAKT